MSNEPVYVAEGSKHAAKLNHEQQQYVIQLLAEGYKRHEVIQKLSEEYGIEFSTQGVYYYEYARKEEILQKRRALVSELDRIASSSKFVRLKELEEQRDRINASDMDDKAKERLILDNNEQRRKETEGFKGVLGFDPTNPFENLATKADLASINKELAKLKKGQKE